MLYSSEINWEDLFERIKGIVKTRKGYSGWDNRIYFSKKGIFFTHELLFWIKKKSFIEYPFVLDWKFLKENYKEITKIESNKENVIVYKGKEKILIPNEVYQSENFKFPEPHFKEDEYKNRDVFIISKVLLKKWLRIKKVHYYVLQNNEIGIVYFNQKYEKLTNVRRKGMKYPTAKVGIYKRNLRIYEKKTYLDKLYFYVNDENWIIIDDGELTAIADRVREVNPDY